MKLGMIARKVVNWKWLCLLAGATFNTNAIAVETINLAGDPWPPYISGELGNDAEGGVAVTIINLVFKQIEGVEVRFPLIPWQQALDGVEQGTIDGIPILVKTAERELFLDYTVPLVTGYNLVWSLQDKRGRCFQWESLDDFKGKQIGVVPGYSYGDEMDGDLRQGKVSSLNAPNVAQLFSMLAAGEVDHVMANDAVGYDLALQHLKVNICAAGQPVNSEIFYIGLSKKSSAKRWLPQINQAITTLHQNGMINKIVGGATGRAIWPNLFNQLK